MNCLNFVQSTLPAHKSFHLIPFYASTEVIFQKKQQQASLCFCALTKIISFLRLGYKQMQVCSLVSTTSKGSKQHIYYPQGLNIYHTFHFYIFTLRITMPQFLVKNSL